MSDPDPNKPSPYAHLVRLAGILIAAGVAFFFVRQAMIPKSWNFEGWYREDAVKQVAAKPMKHGGNHACADCHEDSDGMHADVIEEMEESGHKGLSCEACHGPLNQHVKDGKKIAEAIVENTGLVCRHCHEHRISRPAHHPQFILHDEILPAWREKDLNEAAKAKGRSKLYRHKSKIHAHVDCVNCHYSFHNPET